MAEDRQQLNNAGTSVQYVFQKRPNIYHHDVQHST